jgi:hypothetical protein
MIFSYRPTMRIQLSRRAWFATIAAAILVTSGCAVAADNPPAAAPSDNLSSSHEDIDRNKIERAEPGKEWWRDVVARFPNCATLTDGCQSCVPHDDSLTCSNPGIACTRTEWRCSAEIKPEPPPKDEKAAPKQ